jgi:hypothetical protein
MTKRALTTVYKKKAHPENRQKSPTAAVAGAAIRGSYQRQQSATAVSGSVQRHLVGDALKVPIVRFWD